jgi:hypothetical protein
LLRLCCEKRLANRSGASGSLPRQLSHARLGALEGVTQFDEVRDYDLSESAFDLFRRDLVVPNQKGDVGHVLRVIAAHHLGEDQIEGGGAEQP